MLNITHRPSFVARLTWALLAIMMLTLVIPTRALAQDDKQKKEDQKQKDKQAKADQKAAQQQAKQEKQYQKIKAYSLKEYSEDPEFRDLVDEQYRDLQRKHSLEAYAINTGDPNALLVNRDENQGFIFTRTLYDNPLAQDYVNRLGQSLVPSGSENLYAFKVIQNPVPEARALSTGTVYISTGYLSAVDNEAQLAYILAHEIGHIEKKHWFEDILVSLGVKDYNEEQAKKRKRFTSILTAGAGAVGLVVGGVGGLADTLQLTLLIAPTVLKLSIPNATVQWDNLQEDEADRESLGFMNKRNYDVREVKNFYDRMVKVAAEPRAQTGFMSQASRVADRISIYTSIGQSFQRNGMVVGALNLAESRATPLPQPSVAADKKLALANPRGIARILASGPLAEDIQQKLKNGELLASSEEFQAIMALLKRDNGVQAFQFDMFKMARENLEDSIRLRNNDPYVYYHYGKVLKQTARNPTEISQALQMLAQSITLDRRQTLAEPYFYRAMLTLAERNPNEAQAIINDLKSYVSIYQREHAGQLPPDISVIYDFMQDLGVYDYRAAPAVNVATKDIDPINTTPLPAPARVAEAEAPKPTPAPQPTATPVRRKP
jgi:predicted Zn-dependent protease